MNNEIVAVPETDFQDQPSPEQSRAELIINSLLTNKPPIENNKVLVVLSGGQDSTTCLFLCKMHGLEVHAVTFDYGQRHAAELEAARRIGELAGVASHEFIKLPEGILKSSSPLVDKSAELAQYADHQSLPGGLEKTFVPMRNMLFFTIAANRAYALGINVLVTGVCEEDSGGYPDCRQDFITLMSNVVTVGAFNGEDGAPEGFGFYTPVLHLTKAESVKLALQIPGAYAALAYSHTSYDGAYPPTGHDHATLLRAKGFEQAGVPDPLILRAVGDELMEFPDTPNYAEDKIQAATVAFVEAEERFGWEL